MTDPRFQLNPFLDDLQFKDDVVEAFDEVPRASYFSTFDGPNESSVTGTQGTLGIETGSSATTTLWVATSDGTGVWAGIA